MQRIFPLSGRCLSANMVLFMNDAKAKRKQQVLIIEAKYAYSIRRRIIYTSSTGTIISRNIKRKKDQLGANRSMSSMHIVASDSDSVALRLIVFEPTSLFSVSLHLEGKPPPVFKLREVEAAAGCSFLLAFDNSPKISTKPGIFLLFFVAQMGFPFV